MVLYCDWIAAPRATLRITPSLHPGFIFLPLKLLRTRKAIPKHFLPVFRSKKDRKELTVKKKKLRKS